MIHSILIVLIRRLTTTNFVNKNIENGVKKVNSNNGAQFLLFMPSEGMSHFSLDCPCISAIQYSARHRVDS